MDPGTLAVWSIESSIPLFEDLGTPGLIAAQCGWLSYCGAVSDWLVSICPQSPETNYDPNTIMHKSGWWWQNDNSVTVSKTSERSEGRLSHFSALWLPYSHQVLLLEQPKEMSEGGPLLPSFGSQEEHVWHSPHWLLQCHQQGYKAAAITETCSFTALCYFEFSPV